MEEANKIELDIEKVVEESEARKLKGKKLKKHQEAKKLVNEAKDILKRSESDLQACRLLLEEDIEVYMEAVNSLKKNALDETKALLLKIDDIHLDEDKTDIRGDVFEPKEEDMSPLVLKDVYSGRFTGFLLSLLGGGVTFAGLIYLATEKLGITLDISKMPSNQTIQSIFGWFGTQLGRDDDVMVGGVVVGGTVLAVMAIIYMIRVALKGNANLHFAQKQMEQTQAYMEQKYDCKAQMERVDAHIHEAVKVLKDYEILLGEQKGKLQRIFYFEEGKTKLSEFGNRSLTTMEETQGLIEQIEHFIAVPMSYEGRLSKESQSLLEQSKLYAEKLLKIWN